MKSITDLLKRKSILSRSRVKPNPDEKTVIGVFRDITLSEIKNISPEDFWDVYLKNNILYIKTTHPAVASEILRSREKIKNRVNEAVGSHAVREIKIK